MTGIRPDHHRPSSRCHDRTVDSRVSATVAAANPAAPLVGCICDCDKCRVKGLHATNECHVEDERRAADTRQASHLMEVADRLYAINESGPPEQIVPVGEFIAGRCGSLWLELHDGIRALEAERNDLWFNVLPAETARAEKAEAEADSLYDWMHFWIERAEKAEAERQTAVFMAKELADRLTKEHNAWLELKARVVELEAPCPSCGQRVTAEVLMNAHLLECPLSPIGRKARVRELEKERGGAPPPKGGKDAKRGA